VDYLREKLGATRIATIQSDGFYDLSSARPQVVIRGGVMRGLEYPCTTIYAWRNPQDRGRDMLLLVGVEPGLRWPVYVDTVLDLVARCEARAVYSLGSLFDGVSHTRPPRVSMAAAQPDLRRSMGRLGLSAVNYEGPGSIHTALLDGCRKRNIPAASFWGHVPAYAQLSWNPRVTLALLETVLALLEMPLDLDDLRNQAAQVDDLLNRLVEADGDLQRQVHGYERRHDKDAPSGSLPSADAILSQVEEFLRTSQEDPDDT
jgi:proteasome assembly chaperone (PAC2) family protein